MAYEPVGDTKTSHITPENMNPVYQYIPYVAAVRPLESLASGGYSCGIQCPRCTVRKTSQNGEVEQNPHPLVVFRYSGENFLNR